MRNGKKPGSMTKCSFCGKCAEVCAFNAIATGSEEVLVFPELCHGCGACSYLCPEAAISERKREIGIIEKGSAYGLEYIQGKLTIGEAIATPVIRETKKQLNHDKISIIDAAPGTSCPVDETVKDCDFCLLVTEPTPFGLSDLRLAMEMVQELKVACGVVINRDYGETNAIDDYCFRENIPVLLRIPLDIEIARLYSKGVTLVAGMPHWRQLFSDLFASISKVSTGQKADSCVAIGKGEP